ncbi:MAG: sialidase family protein [Candidatus Hodarchaeota archaeon]
MSISYQISLVLVLLLWLVPVVAIILLSILPTTPGCPRRGIPARERKNILLGCILLWSFALGFSLRLGLSIAPLQVVGWIFLGISQFLLWGGTYLVILLIRQRRKGYSERMKAISRSISTPVFTSSDYNAFPKVLLLKDGRLWLCFYQGNDHVDTKNAGKLVHCFSDDDGKTWGEPTVIANHPELDTRNPALGQLADGTLILMIGIYDRFQRKKIQGQWIYSLDGPVGEKWSDPIDISLNEYNAAGLKSAWLSPYGNLFEVDGGYYAAFYGINDPRRKGPEEAVLLLKLDFQNKKWQFWSDAAKSRDDETHPDGRKGAYNEAVIQPLGDQWICLVRSRQKNLYISISSDLRDWSVPRDSGIRGQAPELIYLGTRGDGRVKYFVAYRAELAYTRGGLCTIDPRTHEIICEDIILDAAPGFGGGDSSYVCGALLGDGTILFVNYYVLKCGGKMKGVITQQRYLA